MIATSNIESFGSRLSLAMELTEEVISEQYLTFRGRNVFCVGIAGSTNPHCFMIPGVGPWIHPDADDPSMGIAVPHLSHQPLGMVWEPTLTNSSASFSGCLALLHTKPVEQRLDLGKSLFTTISADHMLSLATTDNWFSKDSSALPIVVQEFALIVDDSQVVTMAAHIVQAALENTVGPEITVDDEEGIDFHLRLTNGLLVMANVFPDGTIDASVYDDSQGVPVKTVKRMRRGTATERDLIHLFRMGVHVSTA